MDIDNISLEVEKAAHRYKAVHILRCDQLFIRLWLDMCGGNHTLLKGGDPKHLSRYISGHILLGDRLHRISTRKSLTKQANKAVATTLGEGKLEFRVAKLY